MSYQQKTRRALITACAFSRTLVDAAKALGYHTDEPLSKALRKEGVGVTRIENGIAVVHVRDKALRKEGVGVTRIENGIAVVHVRDKARVACVTLHRDGTFGYFRNGVGFHHQKSIPADVIAALTPWERRRIAHRLPEGAVAC